MKNTFLLIFLATASLFVSVSCSKNPANGNYNLMLLSEEQEYELGHDVAKKAIREFGLYKEKEQFTDYYQQLARGLVDITERREKPFEFIMLDSGLYNAWATPGYVNMYRGIMPFFNSEAEFMTVLSHEAGHVTARHAARSVTAGKLTNLAIMTGSILIGQQTESQQTANLANTVGILAATVGFAKYSRVNEGEADGLALRYLERLGYDPREAYNTFKNMGEYSKLQATIYRYFHDGADRPKPVFYDVLLSHPKSESRMQEVIKQAGKPPKNLQPQAQERYFAMLDGVAFGPNFRKHGVAGKNTIYNSNKRFKWTLPDGYYISLIGSQWQAYNDVQRSLATINVKFVDKNEDPEETLRVMYPKLRGFQKLTIHGMQAYTGTQDIVKSAGIFSKKKIIGKQRVFGIKGGHYTNPADKNTSKNKQTVASNRNFYTLTFTAPTGSFNKYDETFYQSADSFTPLTRGQADAIQPLRIKIYTVKKGDTMQSLAERMPFGALQKDWLRVLNGLDRGQALRVGQKIKLIVDSNN